MLQGISFAMTEGKTKPPAHFNEPPLLCHGKSGGVYGVPG